jgi:hypothetical protein
MATTIDALAIQRTLNQLDMGWLRPCPFGEDGWMWRHRTGRRSMIVTCAPMDDGVEWVHASLTGTKHVPPYSELVILHKAVFGDGWAYQVFAPPAEHVNIHHTALHLFGRLDGKPALPDFTCGTGSI